MHIDRRQALSSLGVFLSLSSLSLASPMAGRSPLPARRREFLNAVRSGNLDLVQSLLNDDPNLAKSKDSSGRSAYVLAQINDHPKVAALLLGTGLELDLVESIMAEDWSRFDGLAKQHKGLLNRLHAVGGTPLYAAALVGNLDNWRLRSAGCLVDQAPAGGSGFTPIRGALEAVRPSWARISLCDLGSSGSNINAAQPAGSSVLHACVGRRNTMLLRLAIRKGADVKAVDAKGRTALALAGEIEWEEGLKLLQNESELERDHRASRFAMDAFGEPIRRPDLSDVAAALQSEVTSNSHGNLAKVKELVAKDKRLIFSVSMDDELAIEASAHLGNRALMRFHLDNGAPLSLPTAVCLGDMESTRYWLSEDPLLIHERGAHDYPVFWYALFGGASIEMAEELMQHGVSLDQESMGTTALHWCVRRGLPEFAEFLLKSGCDPEPMGYRWNRAGETPLALSQKSADKKMAALLKSEGASR